MKPSPSGLVTQTCFIQLNMKYPVDLQVCPEGGYFVSFPDIPEALTQGDNKESALNAALDALVTAFEFYFEDNQSIPAPGEITGDYVTVPAAVAAKILLLNTFISSGMTQTELAKRMGVQKQEITRLLNLHHTTKINSIQSALAVLGKSLELTAA